MPGPSIYPGPSSGLNSAGLTLPSTEADAHMSLEAGQAQRKAAEEPYKSQGRACINDQTTSQVYTSPGHSHPSTYKQAKTTELPSVPTAQLPD